MKHFFDILFTVTDTYECIAVEYGTEQTRTTYGLLFDNWVAEKRSITSSFPISADSHQGSFVWENDTFFYRVLPASEDRLYYLLLREDFQEELFAQTLDQLTDGVQIYDRNGCAVFLNATSRKISQIPDTLDIRGRHLMDLFALDENISTTLTALRTQAPVFNRVDYFQTTAGTSISSANTAYPLKIGRQLIGAATFEETTETIASSKKKMDLTEKALHTFQQDTLVSRFSGYSFSNVIGHGEALVKAVEIAKKVAAKDSSVLLIGETGTGKEVFAQSIHKSSPRREKKFVALNCAAIPESLIESLLFGTQKGSFTGSENKPGFFEEAQGGTLFLDELNSMSLAMQSKILRALQESSFRRVGGQKDIHMDVRIISSCNKDPFVCLEENQLRKDLFYRLSTVMIELPPLREHMEDLPELIEYHLKNTAFQYVHGECTVGRDAFEILESYVWPGNVRELFHVLDYAQNLVDGKVITARHLPAYLSVSKQQKEAPSSPFDENSTSPDFRHTSLQALMDEYESRILVQALEFYGYNITKTADALGLRRQSLQYRLRKYGIVI